MRECKCWSRLLDTLWVSMIARPFPGWYFAPQVSTEMVVGLVDQEVWCREAVMVSCQRRPSKNARIVSPLSAGVKREPPTLRFFFCRRAIAFSHTLILEVVLIRPEFSGLENRPSTKR